LEKVNPGVAVSDDQPAWSVMSIDKTIETLPNIVATSHFANATWIFVITVFTAPGCTRSLPLASFTSVATT
jgi:hypothetical protein